MHIINPLQNLGKSENKEIVLHTTFCHKKPVLQFPVVERCFVAIIQYTKIAWGSLHCDVPKFAFFKARTYSMFPSFQSLKQL